MSNSEWGGQTTRESALAEMRKLATEDVNRVLRDVETRKQGLIRAVKARALGVARGFIDRINKGLDDAAATVKVLEDTDFVERLESIKLLADFLKGMVPEGAGQQVAQEDIDGLVDLAESIVIPSVYEPKFASESSENSESSPESGSIIPHEEVRGVESIPVSEKVEPPPSAPAVEVIEKVSENLELTDVAPSTASPSTTPSQLNVAEPVGLSTEGNDNLPAAESTVLPLATLAEEEDNLPPEAAKFKDTLRVERMDRRPKSRDIDEDTSQKDPGQKTKVKTAVPSVPPPNGTPRPLPDDRQDFQTRIRPVPVPDLSHLAGLEVELDKIPRRSTRTKTYQELLAKNQPRVDAVVESRREESAASSGPNLEEIIAEVSAAVKRGEGKEFLLVPEEEEYVERDIRSMARRFGSVIFNKRTSTDKGVKISEAVNSFTSNPNLRADLERVFRKMSKVEILLPDVPVDTSTPPSADLIKSNVHNELVGPNLPPELATPPVGSVDFDVTNPEQRLKAANSDSFLGALMKRTEEGLNRRLKEWSGSERKVTSEAVTLEPTLEEIIAEVSDVIKSEEGKGLVLVPYEEVEEVGVDIRRMNTRFGGINFNKRPPFDKEAEIAREVNAFTSNEKLREDLLRVFRKAARIDGVVTKPAAEERTETGPAVAMPVEQLPTLPKAPTLESIITEIRSAMRKDKSLVFSVPNKEVESSIRRMGNRFGGFDFNKLSPAEKEAEILNDVNEFTLNPQWRAKLEWVFRVIAKVAKVEAGLSAKSLSATDSPDTIATVTTGGGLSQTEFDASQFPRESPFHPESYIQYDGPIGPKIPLQITDALPVGSVALEREARRKSLKFGDLGALAMKDLEKILTEAGPAVLARALISAGDIKFLDPMPESFKAELLKQIKALPKPSDADSAVAQESILEIARKLEAAGTVSFAPKAEAVLPDNTSVAASAANQAIEITPNASNQVLARAVNQGATTASAPAIENVPSAPQKKETRKEKQDRRVKELREQVHAEKKAEVRKNQSGGGKPPVRPPEVAVGAGPEDEPNTGKLELIGTETADVLARKIRPLKTVEFRGKQFEGQAVAELIVNNLAYMGTPGFRNLPPGQRIILVEGFVRDLKTIDPKVADMPFVKALEEALALQVPVRASETVQEISFERRNRLNEGDAVLWVDGDGKILSTRPEIILSFYETDGVVRAFFGESLKKGGGREQNSIRVENLRKFIEDVPENPTEPEKIPPRPIAPIMLVAELVELSPKMIVSPNEAIAKAVLEDPAGFDIGRALDVPGFDEFLIEAQKMGVVIDMADAASLKKRFEAFAFKDAAAAGTYELYAESISQDLGLSLDEEGKREVREHLERQAHVNPESVKSLVDKLKQFKELPPQIAGFERQLDELKATLTPEAQARAKQELTDKQEAFQMVLRTNKFWPGYSEEEGIAGLGRLQHLFGIFSKKSYSGAKARSELSRVPAVRSKGFEKYVTLGTGFSNEQLRTGLQLIEGQLADFGRQMETKSLGVAELEAQRALIKGMLENDKVELFRDNALTRKLVGMARVKVKEKLNSSLIYGEESVDKAVSANELFERTIRASSGNKFGDDGDYFEGVNVSDYRRLIDSTLDRGIEKEIEKSIVRSMALSTGRFGELQKSFDRLTANERLGSKSRSEVRKFIVKKLNSELGLAAGLTTDDSTDEGKKQVTEAKLKVLHLKALIVKQREALALNR